MLRRNSFQLSLSDGKLLDASHRSLIRRYRSVAETAGFQFFLHPHIQHLPHSDVFGLCHELLRFIILHCLTKHGFRLALACRSRILALYQLPAFILHIEAVVPLASFLSHRTFCHRYIILLSIRGSRVCDIYALFVIG